MMTLTPLKLPMKTILLSLGVNVACGVGFAWAQSQANTPPPVAGVPAAGAPVVSSRPDLAEIRKFLEGQIEIAKRLDGEFTKGFTNAQQAGKDFDDMIKSYNDLATLVGSQSEIAKSLNKIIQATLDRAKTYASNPNPDAQALADKFQKEADRARAVKESGIREADSAKENVRKLTEEKDVIIGNFEVQDYDAAIKAAEEQVKVLKDTNERMKKVITDFGEVLSKPTS